MSTSIFIGANSVMAVAEMPTCGLVEVMHTYCDQLKCQRCRQQMYCSNLLNSLQLDRLYVREHMLQSRANT
jgi:hypothetical protein